MYSSEDLERFYFQYQTEALPHGESLQSFCLKHKVPYNIFQKWYKDTRLKHKVPYNIFQKWYKDTRKKIVEVKVDGIPVEGSGETETEPNGRFPNVSQTKDKSVRIWVDIRISNGLHKNLSYQDLVRMIEKLEGLC